MREAGFNKSYITARWGQLEPSQEQFDWRNIDAYQQPADQIDKGFSLLGALSLWFTHNDDFSPRYLRQANMASLKDAAYRYGHQLATRYAGKIDVWEVNELNLDGANPSHLDWSQRLDIARTFARAVKDANPRAQILNGSLALAYDTPDSPPLSRLLAAGVPTDMVGLELYQAGVNSDGHAVVGLDLVAIDALLDQYASFGKPILVKEFSVPSAQVTGSSWWHRAWDEAQQADFARAVYTIAFGKPLVRGITWSWGVADQDAFIRHGGLIDDAAKPKPAYFALRALLASWRSAGQAKTDPAGRLSWRGFAGSYEVLVQLDGREMWRGAIHIAEQQHSRLAVHIPYR